MKSYQRSDDFRKKKNHKMSNDSRTSISYIFLEFQCYPCMYILNLNGEKSQGDTCKRADENEKISANEIVLRIT